jgi:drug/metabolite transporter (DMT)-like permease
MNFLLPFVAVVLQSGSFTIDKVILTLRRVSYKTYTGISFPLIFLFTLVIYSILRPPLSFSLFAGNSWWMILLLVFLIIGTNLFFYRALDSDNLGEIQLVGMLSNFPLILFSAIFFKDERHFITLVASLIASFTIVWSHWENHHLKILKYTLLFVLWTLFTAPLRGIISKELLASWNPISLQLVTYGAVALVLGPFFSKHYEKISGRAIVLLVATNILTSVAWILYYFSYQISGIVYTVLLFSLQPLLVYFASIVLLRERFKWKKFTAFIVVLASVAMAQVMG